MSIRPPRSQRGDTIVEVLIAIAISSSVLGGAYAIVNRTTKSQQQSIEHTTALKLAESQLELLRNNAQNSIAPSIFDTTTPSPFCMNPSTATPVAVTNPACLQSISSTYTTEHITRSGDTFTVRVEWDGINGRRDRVELAYKVFN